MRTLAKETAARGIRVNTIHPGPGSFVTGATLTVDGGVSI